MSVIEINGLTKDYGNQKGLFDVSFTIEKGEILGFWVLMAVEKQR